MPPETPGSNSNTAVADAPNTAAPRKPWSAQPVDRAHLLSDDQVATFICRGYHIIEPHQRAGLNEEIDAQLSAMTQNPGDRILDAVPLLYEVYGHPIVRGTLASLLGHDVQMNSHRHWHNRPPSPWSQGWHQDSTNERHHKTRVVLGLYYPHDVGLEHGPTVVMPGTHFRNAPTDRMASYGNLRGQVALAVKAGTIAITHYDIWHGGSINRSNRVRHMLKFLFNRAPGSENPKAPSWNHDPVEGPKAAAQRFGEWPPFCGQSDHYKQIGLRWECWKHMLGQAPKTPTALEALGY